MLNIIFSGTSIIIRITCNKYSLLTTRNKKYTYVYIVQCPPIQVFSFKVPEICPKSLSTSGLRR